jgi:tetratricopeptide (TPR) repeat protein
MAFGHSQAGDRVQDPAANSRFDPLPLQRATPHRGTDDALVAVVSMARFEYRCCPPGLRWPRFGGPQPLSSSSEIQTVRLPRCRRPASYSGQLVVLYDFLTYLAWLRLNAVIGDSGYPRIQWGCNLHSRAMHQGAIPAARGRMGAISCSAATSSRRSTVRTPPPATASDAAPAEGGRLTRQAPLPLALNRDLVLGLLLVAATFLVYLPAWNGLALWDDNMHLTPPALRSLGGLVRIWTHSRETMQYFPLAHTVFWVEANLWGDSTLGYHLFSILLHAVSALLLVRIVRKLKAPGPWLVAAIFALHPVMVESVAWLSELKNTLSGVFFFAAAATYLTYAETRSRRSYVSSLVLFGLGLLSKGTIATFPLAMLAVLWCKQGSLSWRRDIVPLLPFASLGILAALIALQVEHTHIAAAEPEFELSALERCLLAGRALWFYLGKVALPANLMFFYPRWGLSATVWWQYLFPAAALLSGGILWALRKVSRAPAAALFYFAAMLLPYLGVFSFYTFRYSFVADHYQYLAAVGPIVLAVGSAETALRSRTEVPSQAKAALGVMLALTLGTLSWRQSRMYSDPETLYRATLTSNGKCWVAHNELGTLLARAGRSAEASSHYEKALALNPDSVEAHNNIGLLLSDMGRVQEAFAHYQEVLKRNPDHAKARNNIANLLIKMGQPTEALAQYQKALELSPEFAEAHNNLGLLLSSMGRAEEALAHYQKAVGTASDRGDFQFNLAELLSDMGQSDEGLAHYAKALEAEPDNANFHYSLGLLLVKMGRGDEAMSHYQKALEIDPGHAEAHNNLGILLAGSGQVDEALVHFRRALGIDPQAIGPLTNLAVALAQKGQLADATAVLDGALASARAAGDLAREKKIAQFLVRFHATFDPLGPHVR